MSSRAADGSSAASSCVPHWAPVARTGPVGPALELQDGSEPGRGEAPLRRVPDLMPSNRAGTPPRSPETW